MTMRADGTAVCDRCGGDVGNGGVITAVTVATMGTDGVLRLLHLGLRDGCAAATLLPAGLAARMATDPFTLYEPPPDTDNHPATVTIHHVHQEEPAHE